MGPYNDHRENDWNGSRRLMNEVVATPAQEWENKRFPLLNLLLELSNEADDLEDRLQDIRDQRRMIKKQLTKLGPPPK